jgi:hypothetical protein
MFLDAKNNIANMLKKVMAGKITMEREIGGEEEMSLKFSALSHSEPFRFLAHPPDDCF